MLNMKKTILAMMMAGSVVAASAQTDSMNRNMSDTTAGNTAVSSGSYNAFGTYNAIAPDYMETYVLRDYPGATNIRWQQNGDWWHGYYMNNNQPTHLYYTSSGATFTAALPVKQNMVPDDVIS